MTTDKDRYTDRQIERQIEYKIDRQKERQIDRQMDRKKERKKNRQIYSQTGIDIYIDRKKESKKDRQLNIFFLQLPLKRRGRVIMLDIDHIKTRLLFTLQAIIYQRIQINRNIRKYFSAHVMQILQHILRLQKNHNTNLEVKVTKNENKSSCGP